MNWRFGLTPLVCITALAQTQPQNPDAVIRSSVREVVLDMTVRNKSEKLVRDLRADEVEVYVDGALQTVRSFQLVRGEETRKLESATPVMAAATAKSADKLPPPNSAREINLVVLVFRTGSTEQRARAQKAALAFVAGEARPNTYIAALTMTRMTTRVAQPFTANTGLLTEAINRTLTHSGTRQPGTELAALTLPGPPPEDVRGPGPTARNLDPANAASSKLDASVSTGFGAAKVRELESEALFTDANTDAMFEMDRYREILNQLAGMPGRKTVVAMTTALATPPERQEVFRKLIDDARKMGVTFYGVGLNGLTPSSSMSGASTYTAAAAGISQTQGKTPAVSREQATQDDRILYSVTAADADNALRVLAESTGGLMISSTNDVAHQMPRIMDEVNTHYELSWTPMEARYDGKFHKIEVKLKRPGLHAQCREGYYGLPDLNGRQFQSFELTGIRTLESKPLPKDFEFRASALRFSPSGDGWHGIMAFEAPIASFASIDPTVALGANMQVVGTAVALVKDASGEIVGMVSDKVSYEVPGDKRDGFLAGNLTMTLPIQLQPGRWTIEATMMSPSNQTASAKRISVLVPKAATPAISSITLARRIEPRTGATSLLGPFDIGASRVTPTLTDSIPSGASQQLYFVVYPSAESKDKPKVVVQYFRDGRQVGQGSPAFRDDGSGTIPMLAAAKLAPGEYEVRVTATQGGRASRETAWIRVEP